MGEVVHIQEEKAHQAKNMFFSSCAQQQQKVCERNVLKWYRKTAELNKCKGEKKKNKWLYGMS